MSKQGTIIVIDDNKGVLSVKLRSIQRKGGLKPTKSKGTTTQPTYMLVNIGQGGEA